MKIIVNAEPREVAGKTLADALTELEFTSSNRSSPERQFCAA